MHESNKLKEEISSKLDQLKDLDLKEVADFVSFLVIKNSNSYIKNPSDSFDIDSWKGCLSKEELTSELLENELKDLWSKKSK